MSKGFAASVALLFLIAGCQTRIDIARDDYYSLCAGCHGSAGRGDGPLAAQWPRAVPDLTILSAGNNGRYPTGYVISTIDGSSRIDAHGAMPQFWSEIEGELVRFETTTGGAMMVPRRVVELAAYVESLQR